MRTLLQAIWVFITDLGDTAVTVPLALLTCCFLGAVHELRLAFGLGLAILGCAGATSILKLVLAACEHQLTIPGLSSPSGHTAMSTAVYGSMCLLIATSSPPVVRALVSAGGRVLIAGIAASRFVLRHHTPSEVAVGLIIGLVAVIGFRLVLGDRHGTALPIQWLLGAAFITVTLLHGDHWSAEPALRDLTWFFQFLVPICG